MITSTPTEQLVYSVQELSRRTRKLETQSGVFGKMFMYNARDYGVAGDGVVDDFSRIQQLVDAIPDNSHLYFPDGLYRLTQPISITERNHIVFSGPGIIVPERCNGFVIDAVQDFQIRDLSFSTAMTGNTYTAIDIHSTTLGNNRYVQVINCHLYGFKYGVRVRSTGGSSGNCIIRNSWFELTSPSISGSRAIWLDDPDNKIFNNTIQRHQQGIYCIGGSQVISGNHIWASVADSPVDDISLRRGETASTGGYVITGNYLDGHPSDGHLVVNAQAVRGLTVQGNNFRASGTMSQYIQFINGGSTADAQDITITGNIFYNASGGTVAVLTLTGIQTDGSDSLFIHSNTMGANVTGAFTAGGIQTYTHTGTTYQANPMLGRMIDITLQANITMNAMDAIYKGGVGNQVTFKFIQDGTGGRTVAWNADFRQAWSNTGNTANKVSTITFEWNGTDWFQVGAQSPYY